MRQALSLIAAALLLAGLSGCSLFSPPTGDGLDRLIFSPNAVQVQQVPDSFTTGQPLRNGKFVRLLQSPDRPELWKNVIGRSSVVFAVSACNDDDGLLWRQAQQAARDWNRYVGSAQPIQLIHEPCTNNPDSISADGQSFLYYASYSGSSLGRYIIWVDRLEGTVAEEDIQIAAGRLREKASASESEYPHLLYTVIVHEFGHALGLGDAYFDFPQDCGWSVMLKVCQSRPTEPQDLDVETLAFAYGRPLGPSTNSGPEQFDLNRDGLIGDNEVLIAIDAWIASKISDDLLFRVIDLWVAGEQL